MNAKQHALLGELHRLLGIYSESDFLQTAKCRGAQGPLRDALEALAAESRSERSTPRQGSPPKVSPVVVRQKQAKKIDAPLDLLILYSRYGTRLATLVDLASEHGLHLQPHPKESKSKYAKRLSKRFKTVFSPSQVTSLEEHLAANTVGQTEGWAQVIRRRS
jgi:hypothetical protein